MLEDNLQQIFISYLRINIFQTTKDILPLGEKITSRPGRTLRFNV